jgi:transposase
MRYTSDMSDKQWEIIRPLLKEKGYRNLEKRREQVNANICTH